MMRSDLFSFQNVYRAYADCRRTKRNTPDALRFELRAEENLRELQRELADRTYRPSASACFVARQPKLREIFAADFRDRILHHLVVRYLEAIWEPVFIHDSYASRAGKGIHAAVERLQRFTRQATCNATRPAWYLQLDIQNFFMRINKQRLFALIRSRCRQEEILWLTSVLIFHDPTEEYHRKSPQWLLDQIPRQKSLFGVEREYGLPIGNLTSQFFANIYLNGLDQFVKHTLKCRWYLRYVDDVVLLSPQPEELHAWQAQIAHYLETTLELSLHPTRRKLRPIANGIDFLGYIVRPQYRLCRNRVVNNLKARLREFEQAHIRMQGAALRIAYPPEELDALFAALNSYFGHFSHANTRTLRRQLFARHGWLTHYFVDRRGKVERLYVTPRHFYNLREQYRYFASRFYRSLIFFQVGCFYEWYERQAIIACRVLGLNLIAPKFGVRRRCGIGVKALDRYVNMAVQRGYAAVIINQTGYELRHVAERRIAVKYLPVKERNQ